MRQDASSYWCLGYWPLHLGKLRLNQSKSEALDSQIRLFPLSQTCSVRHCAKGTPNWEEVKPPFTLVQSTTYCTLHVCWLIWCVVSDVTFFFSSDLSRPPRSSWWTNDSIEQRLDFSRTTRGGSSSIYVRAMHLKRRREIERCASITSEQGNVNFAYPRWSLIRSDRYDCDQHQDRVANCSRDTAVVVQVSYFECNFGKMGLHSQNWQLFFSSDSKLTKRWKGNKYQFMRHAGTHPE